MEFEHDKVLPSTSKKGKRKSDHQGGPSQQQSAKRQRESSPGSDSEARILSEVKAMIEDVMANLQDQHKLNDFIKKIIKSLDNEKKELVGVFGKTGAGKSSLINAIIEEKNLLPSSNENACTSVMIKVEANMDSKVKNKYQADIEFITEQEWRDELWSALQSLHDKKDQEVEGDNSDDSDEDGDDIVEEDDDSGEEDDDSGEEDDDSGEEDEDPGYIHEKMSALYGKDWKQNSNKSFEYFTGPNFKDIEDLLQSGTKTLKCRTAEELSAKLIQYTRSSHGEMTKIKRWYWPLVKCVTVKVPNNPFLQHVTLVDLPGNGDDNKNRDEMWKQIVGNCSTVWIVTDIIRAESDKEAWDILKRVRSLIGNGGECQRIHFICTKSDVIGNPDDLLHRNQRVKEKVTEKFKTQKKIKKHFEDDCFKVFTVSSTEFFEKKWPNLDDTEIPQLQEWLKELNSSHSETLNFVFGVYMILSVIQEAERSKSRELADTKVLKDLQKDLQESLKRKVEEVKKGIEKICENFEKHLCKGVNKSKNEAEKKLKEFLDEQNGRGFHQTLKSVVQKEGVHTTNKGKGKQINFNMDLASCLTDSIDVLFSKTFPCAPWSDTVLTDSKKKKSGPFNGLISAFSLGTHSRTQKIQDFKQLLTFLKNEEDNVKVELNVIIREQKKKIYNSLTDTIKENMTECYKDAAKIKRKGTLKKMKKKIKDHVLSNTEMYDTAKNAMLKQLNDLKKIIVDTLDNNMKEAIELLFETGQKSLPDVSENLDWVKECYHELCQSRGRSALL